MPIPVLSFAELFDLLERYHDLYNRTSFIELDPICIPHQYSNKEDIEISGFFAATLAWGQRKTILRNTNILMERMDHSPHEFIIGHSESEASRFEGFMHRTYQSEDCKYFLRSLQNMYINHKGLGGFFEEQILNQKMDMEHALIQFKKTFFELNHPLRTEKHVSSPLKNSACKRMNMYLRWMIRKDKRGVDLGIWNKIPSSLLICPLDVHSGRVARNLGLLTRTQNDWKAAMELTKNLQLFSANDPVKYDFALFGAGVHGIFKK